MKVATFGFDFVHSALGIGQIISRCFDAGSNHRAVVWCLNTVFDWDNFALFFSREMQQFLKLMNTASKRTFFDGSKIKLI